MKLRIIIFIFSAIVSLSGYAQTYTFNHLGIEDGMSQNQVNGITKDQFGFMWFGTWDGLNRFDGYNFKVFKHRAFDTTSLSSNFISCLLTDSKGRIWIGTNGGGLNLFLPKSETFKIFYFDPIKENSLSNNSINIMLEDSQNRIWIATEFGLNLINQNDTSSEFSINQFFFQNPLTNESANEIKSIVEISKGEFLLGTNRGLINLHIQDGSKFSYNFLALHPLNQNTFEDMHIQSLYMDSLDRIWIGLREGLYLAGKLEKKGDIKLKQIKLESNMALDSKPHEINFINQDIEGKLWVGTQTGGLFICNDLEIQNFVQIRDDNSIKVRMRKSFG
jgi:ligand-binding sensor domain-containing protein